MTTVLSDHELFLLAATSSSIIYLVLSYLYGRSQIPVLVAVFVFSNMISRTNLFQSFIQNSVPYFSKLIDRIVGLQATSLPKLSSSKGPGYDKFLALSDNSQLEILTAVKSLQAYATNSKKTNDRRRKLFKLMTWRQQKLCEDIGYLDKLKKIDTSIQSNQSFLNAIADKSVTDFGLSYHDFEKLKNDSSSNQTSSTNYRVIEAIGHYLRDWNVEGFSELNPILKYVRQQLDATVPVNMREKTCIVIPGSGLGRVAHEVAKFGSEKGEPTFGAVYGVEYSGLMHACNQFIYADKSSDNKTSTAKTFELFPHVHSCSNLYDTASQFRKEKVQQLTSKPDNLHLSHEDFRYFKIDTPNKFENIIVVSVFFIDTAENLINYLDAIHSLTTPNSRNNNIKRGHWINVGPLKYGSAAQVELNADELKQIRAKMGWVDKDYKSSLHSNQITENGLVGYVTDKSSMWQGYYGLTMWNSARKENSTK
ncbi:N2227-like protein-domain-containing protein [Scheffersomyces coipomensis]|uniref:N2227-like protein-domain-containing protein n=1 Tax=Scheffersomyces coipomensis TaxID=1788519 RepID=UPI00315D2E9C